LRAIKVFLHPSDSRHLPNENFLTFAMPYRYMYV
jgi:hypothetical protein